MKKLKRVKLINWHRFTDAMIDFEQSTLISGENGAGKSTLLDAIQFVITCSTNYFNKAAHENGKRELTGYVRCKTGRENRPYERIGEISAHVALEFYEEEKNNYFVIGAVIDSSSEGQEKTARYLMNHVRLEDGLFYNGKTPKSISQFRTSNSKRILQWCTTDKEAKKMIKNRLGRIEDKFFRLIPKALAFRPIKDIKDFVYSYVLDKKEVNIDILRENVRTYQDLQRTLNNIKIRLGRLEEVEHYHKLILDARQKDSMYEYFLERAKADKLAEWIKKLENAILHENIRLKECNGKILELKKEKTERQKIRDDLYTELASDKDFIARDEQEKKLQALELRKKELQTERVELLKSINQAKAECNKLLQMPEVGACVKTYAQQLEDLEKGLDISDFKDTLADAISYKEEMSTEVSRRLFQLENDIRTKNSEKQEMELRIANLKKKKFSYPSDVNRVAYAIREEFERIGRKSEPRILCELLEITDDAWRNAVEGYLNTQRFYILVEPDHFDVALGTYDKLRKEQKAYGVGLINTQKLDEYDKAPEGSLATVVTSKNKYAKRYINMVLGKVMMCNHYSELKKYKIAITKECMRYQNHVASAIRPEIFEIPYIGKNAIRVQLDQVNARLNELVKEIEQQKKAAEKLESLKKPLSWETETDIKYKVDVLTELKRIGKQMKQCKENIATLDRNSGMILKRIQLSQLDEILSQLEIEMSKWDRLYGEINNSIKVKIKEKETTEAEYAQEKSNYLMLASNADHHLVSWNNEYEKQTKEKGYEQFYDNYSKRRKANQTIMDTNTKSMEKSMVEYKTAHSFGAAATLLGYPEFEAEYIKLKNSELLSYEEKVENARKSAEDEFREQFLAKLQENMKNAQTEFKELNKALKDIHFSNEKYEFSFMPSKKYRHYYEMIMDDFNAIQGESIFSGLFHENHKEVIDELFERLALDNDNNAKALDEFTDYRTYMDYDIRIAHSDGNYSLYSKVCEEKSGGETQTPFYVTVAASFVQLYRSGIGGETAGLVMFDEAFNNMDDERIGGVLEFLRRLPLQIIIAAPPDKIQYISPSVEQTLLVMTDEKVSFVEKYYNGSIR